MKPIIDVSYYNQVTDWKAVKDAVAGVIIRMGYRGYAKGSIVYDKKYKEYRQAVEQLKIPHSFYFFPQSITDEEAIQEAEFIAREIEDAGELMGPVWLDSEIANTETKNGRADNLSTARRTWLLKVIIETLKTKGITAGVYASTSWLNNNLNMTLLPYPVWVAQYASTCKYAGPYILWQYTDKLLVPGIKGRVDASQVKINVLPQQDTMTPELKNAIDVIAKEVLNGRFGTGHETRSANIYNLIKKRVNELCS